MVVVVAGILATTRYRMDVPVGLIVLAGTALLGGSTIQLTRVLAGFAPYGLIAYGPDLPRLLAAAKDPTLDQTRFLISLVGSATGWITDNGTSMRLIQKAKGRAINLYIVGAILLLGSAVYITGGTIHG